MRVTGEDDIYDASYNIGFFCELQYSFLISQTLLLTRLTDSNASLLLTTWKHNSLTHKMLAFVGQFGLYDHMVIFLCFFIKYLMVMENFKQPLEHFLDEQQRD